jgi:hypothetical protein
VAERRLGEDVSDPTHVMIEDSFAIDLFPEVINIHGGRGLDADHHVDRRIVFRAHAASQLAWRSRDGPGAYVSASGAAGEVVDRARRCELRRLGDVAEAIGTVVACSDGGATNSPYVTFAA